MKKYDYILGIDPDTEKSGVALVNVPEGRLVYAASYSFPKLLDMLYASALPNMILYVEAGWMVKKSNFHGQTGSRGQRVAKNVGANHETGKKIIEMAKHYGIEVQEIHPLRKCWTGPEGKITQEEIEYFIPGFPKRTNQDSRDAALICWYQAGLTIKMKTKK